MLDVLHWEGKQLARIAKFKLYDQTNDDCKKMERAKKTQRFIEGEVCVKSVIPNTIVATLKVPQGTMKVEEVPPVSYTHLRAHET